MRSKLARAGVAGASLLGAGVAVAVVTQLNDLQRVDAVDDRAFTHSDQLTIRSSDFDDVFEAGDAFFDTAFNLLDGGGANVGRGQRMARTRATRGRPTSLRRSRESSSQRDSSREMARWPMSLR